MAPWSVPTPAGTSVARAEKAASRNIETDARNIIDKGWKRCIRGPLGGRDLTAVDSLGQRKFRLIQVAAAASARFKR
jgi:hypothetical protein